jgi:hypothetical protein
LIKKLDGLISSERTKKDESGRVKESWRASERENIKEDPTERECVKTSDGFRFCESTKRDERGKLKESWTEREGEKQIEWEN